MDVLFLAPLPPPINGHSLASRVLLDGLAIRHNVDVIDIGRESAHTGALSSKRIRAVGRVLREFWLRQRRADVIYLTISESLAGNLKDLMVYALCGARLSRVCIHLHGGSIKRELFDRYPVIRRLNSVFLKRVGAVIICGDSHRAIFDGLALRNRVHVVTNFSQDILFLDDDRATLKWTDVAPLRVVYISGMIERKGYGILLDAFLALPEDARARFRLDFAGGFESTGDEDLFRGRIANIDGVAYHGIVDGEAKRQLFAQAHLFALPTMFFEGQPLSILEAYASACAVITTGQSGILDIFRPEKNGILIEPGSVGSLADALSRAMNDTSMLRTMAFHNRNEAKRAFTANQYVDSVDRVLTHLATKA